MRLDPGGGRRLLVLLCVLAPGPAWAASPATRGTIPAGAWELRTVEDPMTDSTSRVLAMNTRTRAPGEVRRYEVFATCRPAAEPWIRMEFRVFSDVAPKRGFKKTVPIVEYHPLLDARTYPEGHQLPWVDLSVRFDKGASEDVTSEDEYVNCAHLSLNVAPILRHERMLVGLPLDNGAKDVLDIRLKDAALVAFSKKCDEEAAAGRHSIGLPYPEIWPRDGHAFDLRHTGARSKDGFVFGRAVQGFDRRFEGTIDGLARALARNIRTHWNRDEDYGKETDFVVAAVRTCLGMPAGLRAKALRGKVWDPAVVGEEYRLCALTSDLNVTEEAKNLGHRQVFLRITPAEPIARLRVEVNYASWDTDYGVSQTEVSRAVAYLITEAFIR